MSSKPPRKGTDEDYTLGCPDEDCQSTRIRPFSSKSGWYCCDCKGQFDEPEHRERMQTTPAQMLTGAARTLWDADPSEYP